ncbi:Nuclear pore complex protein Nup205 [Eumeta japonica]|uniref:Nuclear pore complex protein Nup205 n=1 Tax=Eumeta variegata TaxID=151549 RepID=A0A4C1TTJ3_EUMVA|nr:Nuclear pore complex protein Nup205 [Eumeta japonica]
MKTTWGVIKNETGKIRGRVIDFKLKLDDKTLNEDTEVAKAFETFFTGIPVLTTSSLNSSPALAESLLRNNSSICDINLEFKYVSSEEVIKTFKSLDMKRTADIHGLSIVIPIIDYIAPHLAFIFNKCLDDGVFPDLMKDSKVISLFKGGSASSPNNFRPISILPSLSKIFEKLIIKQLLVHFYTNKLMSNKQFGFTRGRSTIDAGVELVQHIFGAWEDSRDAISIFCDLSKAFDCVHHETLIGKLRHYGVTGRALDLLKSYLSNRVDVNGKKSSGSIVHMGVPQGTILGPFLFLVYINDLPSLVKDAHEIVLFADDTFLLFKVKRQHPIYDGVNNAISKVEKWFTAKNLLLNEMKTKCIRFSLPNVRHGSGTISVRHKELKFVNFTVFLGITLDNRLQWVPHIRTTTEDLWTPYKELVCVVEGYLTREGGGAPYAVHTFESVLRRHRQTFLSLLKNPTANATSREEIKRGITEGVNLPSVGRTLLSKELVDEAIIISDMYNVNEYLALELLHTAQRQLPRHPGLSRGLLAVVLYYDGKRAIAQALKELVMACEGISWCINAREEVVAYVTRYIEQLITDGLLNNTLDALRRFDLAAELDLLQRNRALPPPRHHMKLVNSIESTRKLLAGVIFAASAQRGLNRDILLRLLSESALKVRDDLVGTLSFPFPKISAVAVQEQIMKSPMPGGGDPTGALDEISLALQMALLYAFDLSILHSRDDGEEMAKKLPLIQDPDLISVLIDELQPPSQLPPQLETTQAKNSAGVRALCQLSLGLALAALKRAPQPLLRRPNGEIKAELLDQDEALVDAAIDAKVFEYLDEAVLSSELIVKEEYYQKRLHSLMTDFIVLQHSKLMEMRVKADEAARAVQMYAAEGLAPPAAAAHTRGHLDALLRCVEKLYQRDPLKLRDEYWAVVDQQHSHSHRSGGRAATLYKFVRLSGELVAPPLLPAYLRALASLAVERHTWALLAPKDNAAHVSAHHLLTALARYYSNLRQDPSPLAEQHVHASSLGASAVITPAARPGRLLVRHEEVEAMIAALKLIGAVARIDHTACAAICENLQWDVVNTMFGLICCHIPLPLKAELCLTLAALGGTAATAARVWAGLEAAQLVRTVPAERERRALSAELQEVECRLEEYPLTRAFLCLLESLCLAAPVPRALGAGARPPGLDPYLEHVLQRIALPAPHRSYAKQHEKWQVLGLCLRLFTHWLEQYEPSVHDFSPMGIGGAVRPRDTNPPPGFHLLLQLHTKSDLLRLVFNTLDETLELMDSSVHPLHGKSYVEECMVWSLRLLEGGLQAERALTREAANAGRAALIIGLSKLLVAPEGLNDSDRLVSCCRVLRQGPVLPAAAARAVALLCLALRQPAAARQLLCAVTRNHSTAVEIRHGFVECLEIERGAEGETGAAVKQTKEGIVLLMQQCLPMAPPNFAHYLLGYQLTEDVSRSQLNEPGVAGSSRTCLHSLLDILGEHLTAQDADTREASDLVESCYKLLYWICARPNTSAPALRLLRSRDHFLTRHLKATINLETASVVSISARSWALRACACEMGAAAAARHHAALHNLLVALTETTHHPTQEWEWCLLMRLCEGLRTRVASPVEPRWEYFHAPQLRAAIASCDLPTGLGGKRINVTRVHALLVRELAALQATTPQRNLVQMEIEKVLNYVTEVNRQRNLAATLTHYYDSWRQLTEILFCVAPQDMLNLESKKNLILNILQDLLNKISPAEVLPQLGNLASGTVLLLLVNLRHCYILQKRDSSLKIAEFELSFFGPSSQLMQSKSLTLKFILHKILSWILISGGSTQKMRVNLYGALLNYLNIVNLKSSSAEPEEDEMSDTYVSRLDSSKAKVNKNESSLKFMAVDVISGFGNNLCSVVCGDCIGAGHDVCRMVALSCLDTLIEIYPHTEWMNTLTNQGYLRNLIDSLLQDDEGLREALEPSPKSLRVLYVYESKMALLMKIASTRMGAETVLAQGALACLANMKSLDCHPDIHTGKAAEDTEFVPSVATRYRQMLIPALALCDALLTTLGSQNHSCVMHVTHLLLSHMDAIDIVLRAAHPNSPSGLLIELEAITSVIARSSNREVWAAMERDSVLGEGTAGAAGACRLQTLMLALIPRFSVGAGAVILQPDGERQRDEPHVYYKIVCNLLTYARNILEKGSGRALFRPALSAAPDDANRTPHCGAIVQLVQNMVVACGAQSKLLATVAHQWRSVPAMTIDDMKKLLPSEVQYTSGVANGSPSETRALLVSLLRRRERARRRDAARCRMAVELGLHLVWVHLHVYLRRSVDAVSAHNGFDDTTMSPAGALRGAWGATGLAELRRGLAAVFNDRFTDQLLDIAKGQPASQRGLLELLIKDIKSMIQFSSH